MLIVANVVPRGFWQPRCGKFVFSFRGLSRLLVNGDLWHARGASHPRATCVGVGAHWLRSAPSGGLACHTSRAPLPRWRASGTNHLNLARVDARLSLVEPRRRRADSVLHSLDLEPCITAKRTINARTDWIPNLTSSANSIVLCHCHLDSTPAALSWLAPLFDSLTFPASA